jgi:hypothetical protein
VPGFSTTLNRLPSQVMPRSITFGEEPPPQQETLSRAARASGVPTCSDVIHTLAMPAQVMLPDPPLLPTV